jgi:PEP-CTERM motif
MKRNWVAGLGLAALAMPVWAVSIVPAYTNFGPLPAATFSGTGIENNAVAVTTGAGFTIGLTAHARYGVPPLVTNNGAGTFYATRGIDTGLGTTVGDPWAKWNVDYYVNGNTKLFDFVLLYDFNPSVGTPFVQHGYGFVPISANSSNATAQDSFNLGFDVLATSVPGYSVRPVYAAFDPTASGEYSFALVVLRKGTAIEVGRSAILVSVVPEASSYAMLMAGLAAVGLVARRRRAG